MRKSILLGSIVCSLVVCLSIVLSLASWSDFLGTKSDIIGKQAPDFTLEDVQGRRVSLMKREGKGYGLQIGKDKIIGLKGKVLILQFGEKEAFERIREWRSKIMDLFPNSNSLLFLNIAVVRHDFMLSEIKKGLSNEPDIWLIEELKGTYSSGKVVKNYGIRDADRPNLFLIDENGKVYFFHIGGINKNALEDIGIKIREILSDQIAIGRIAPDFSLESGQGRNVSLSGQKGKVVVLIFGSRAASQGRERWKMEFVDNFTKEENLTILSISSITKNAPKFLVRGFHKDDTGLFDWDRKVTNAYGIKDINKPNIFLIDKEGILHYHWAGNFSDESLKEVVEKIRKLLALDKESDERKVGVVKHEERHSNPITAFK